MNVLYTVNVTGETLGPNKIFPGFMLGKSLLYVVTISIFQLNAGKTLALCWENSILAPVFHQSRLQCG